MLARELEVLERHLKVLALVKRKGPISMLKISKELQIQAHKVRYSLRVLQRERLVTPTTAGAIVTTKVGDFSRDMQSLLKRLEGIC
ncbi:MAG: hypothetical protein KAT35_00460 [Candidatus Aenigmarchaeota archaeon]|nr:hypothetical protein [Candidatus Aenigmarchaeota archaeon]